MGTPSRMELEQGVALLVIKNGTPILVKNGTLTQFPKGSKQCLINTTQKQKASRRTIRQHLRRGATWLSLVGFLPTTALMDTMENSTPSQHTSSGYFVPALPLLANRWLLLMSYFVRK